jgi:hypothetical protein
MLLASLLRADPLTPSGAPAYVTPSATTNNSATAMPPATPDLSAAPNSSGTSPQGAPPSAGATLNPSSNPNSNPAPQVKTVVPSPSENSATPASSVPSNPNRVLIDSQSGGQAPMQGTAIATPSGPPSGSLEGNSPSGTSFPSVGSGVTKVAKTYGHSGVVYMFSLANWVLFNNTALAYTPVELGYDFGNGVRLVTGYDLFYYQGLGTGLQQYSYVMSDWRTSVIYRYPMTQRLRPILGMSFDFVGGSQHLAPVIQNDVDINADTSSGPAWGFVGIGAIAGAEWLVNEDWSLQLSEHYIADFGNISYSPTVTQLGVMIVF